MNIQDKLGHTLKISESRMSGWVDTIHFEVAGIKPNEDRARRLSEIKDMIHTSFLGEMGNHYREFPITAEELYDWVDELFEVLGYGGPEPRRKPLKKPPWQTN
jgi:hypothetical protein